MSRGSFVDQASQISHNKSVASKILLVYEEYSEMMVAQNTLLKVGYDVLGISTEYTVSENVLSFNPDVVVGCGKGGKVTTIGVGRRMREMARWQGKCILIFPAGFQPNPQDFAKIRGDILLESPIPGVRLLQVIAQLVGDDEAALMDRLAKQSALDLPDQGPIIVDSLPKSPKEAASFEPPQFEIPNSSTAGAAPSIGSAKSERADAPTAGSAKADQSKGTPDLESLWKELTDGAPSPATSEAPKSKISFDLKERQEEMSEFELGALAKELENVKKTERERVARYAKITSKMDPVNTPQGFSKVKSRQVQKELVKSWNRNEIADLDQLRREFTQALFRKK